MSKSLGNFFTVREILQRYQPEVVRYFILRAQYRSPLNYSDAHLDDARSALRRLYTALRDAPSAPAPIDWSEPHAKRFKAAMDDDFGTPEAIAVLHELANQVFQGNASAASRLKALGAVVGILQDDPDAFLQGRAPSADAVTPAGMTKSVQELIREREEARKRKDFREADRIRKDLLDHGIVLEDKGGTTTWRRV
jgi:cysteinyl-tRNA synthetase